MDEGLKKSPHWPDAEGGVLIGVALVAGGEELVPRVVPKVLRRGPVVVTHESSNTRLSQIGIHQHRFTY